MSDKNQEQETIESGTDNHIEVDKSKRKFSKAGMAAPVIMTLASKPVFAVQGLSNMISGTGSEVGCVRGDNRYGGMSPGYWKKPNPGQTPLGDTTSQAWQIAGYDYGNVNTGVGGSVDSRFGSSSSTTLSQVLLNESNTDDFQYVAGLLNAHYFANKAATSGGSLNTQYFLSVAQFDDLFANDPAELLRLLIAYQDHLPGSESDSSCVISPP